MKTSEENIPISNLDDNWIKQDLELEKFIKNSELKKSPIFNFSLSSKELFHSNFLAWLFESYKPVFGKILSRFIHDKTGNISIQKIERESKNLDLTIIFENGQKLIIENKLKSIPYREQLKQYSKERKSEESYILLSPRKPEFDLREIGWEYFSYAELGIELGKIIKGDLLNDYHTNIVKDYLQLLDVIQYIEKVTRYNEDAPFDFAGKYPHDVSCISKGYQSIVDEDLRIQDFYQKMKFQSLADKVTELIKEKYNKEDVQVRVGMTRATGILDVVIPIIKTSDENKDWEILIQIQGNEYRQFISAPKKKIEQVRDRLFGLGLWFDLTGLPYEFELNRIVPIRDKKVFRGYDIKNLGRHMYYRGLELRVVDGGQRLITDGGVIQFILNDIERVMKLKAKICNIINE